MQRRQALRALVSVSGGLIAGCANQTGTPEPTQTATSTSTSSDLSSTLSQTSQSGTETATASGAKNTIPDFGEWLTGVKNYDGGVVDKRGTKQVTIEVGARPNNFSFAPPAVWVSPGTTVQWRWTGKKTHNVSAVEGAEFRTDIYSKRGVHLSKTFEQSKIVKYQCDPHAPLGARGAIAIGTQIPMHVPETSPTPSPTPPPTPTPPPEAYAAWLPAPERMGLNDVYRVLRIEPPSIQANRQYIKDSVYSFVKQAITQVVSPAELGFDDITSILYFGGIRVVSGTYDVDTVTTNLKSNGYEQVSESLLGFAIYYNSETESRVGINGKTMVWKPATAQDIGQVETAIFAKRGKIPRLGADRPGYTEFVSRAGTGAVLGTLTPDKDEFVVQGSRETLNGETCEIKNITVYESPDVYDKSTTKSNLDSLRQKDGVKSVSITFDGRVVILHVSAETKTYGSSTIRTIVG